jgi:hypothetical protein
VSRRESTFGPYPVGGGWAGCGTPIGSRGSVTSFRITVSGRFTMGWVDDLRAVAGATGCWVRSLGCWTCIVGLVPAMMGSRLFGDAV